MLIVNVKLTLIRLTMLTVNDRPGSGWPRTSRCRWYDLQMLADEGMEKELILFSYGFKFE